MTGSVRIKICGVQDVEDALAAVEAGADLIGINFVEGSKRRVDVPRALEICEALEEHDVELCHGSPVRLEEFDYIFAPEQARDIVD